MEHGYNSIGVRRLGYGIVAVWLRFFDGPRMRALPRSGRYRRRATRKGTAGVKYGRVKDDTHDYEADCGPRIHVHTG
jgi:hypothetical protein